MSCVFLSVEANEALTCPQSNLGGTIIINGCDSQVENQLLDNGCTMTDLISQCEGNAKNHGQFVSCVTSLTNDWKKEGRITKAEKSAIQKCSANSNINIPDISGVWLLYLIPKGSQQAAGDCIYIYPVKDGQIFFMLRESSQLNEKILQISGSFISRNSIKLEGHGWYQGEDSLLTVSATVKKDTIIGDYVYSNAGGIEEVRLKR